LIDLLSFRDRESTIQCIRRRELTAIIMTKLTVIYFTVVPISSSTNGGNIACRNHIDRLNRDPNIDLRVLAAPTSQDVAATEEFLRRANIEHIVIPRREGNFHQADNTVMSTLRFAALSAVYFPWELEARLQPQYDEALEWAMKHWQADLIVIDYTFSALFCPKVMRGPIKKAIVTFNREAEFYRDMIGLGMIRHDRFSAEISARRLARFEPIVNAIKSSPLVQMTSRATSQRSASPPSFRTLTLESAGLSRAAMHYFLLATWRITQIGKL
jgi:hypothetical protein